MGADGAGAEGAGAERVRAEGVDDARVGTEPGETTSATTLRRGIGLLVELGTQEAARAGGLGVVRLAQLTGHDKSQVSRTLRILAEAGLVDRVPTSQAYRLGWRLYGLAAVAGDARLREEAPRLLVDLVGRVGERAHVSVLEAGAVLTLWSEAPPSAIQAAGWVGRSVPAHCSSSGRALLMDHDPAALVSLFGEGALEPSGPNGPRHVDDLVARVAAAARVGYAVVDEEFEVGLVAVAAPVRDFRGTIVAAINVSGPKFRLRPHLDRAAEATLAAARRLTALLGGEPALEASRYEPDQREANP